MTSGNFNYQVQHQLSQDFEIKAGPSLSTIHIKYIDITQVAMILVDVQLKIVNKKQKKFVEAWCSGYSLAMCKSRYRLISQTAQLARLRGMCWPQM